MSAKLIHGDCLDVLAGMGDGSVDHVITDPPYSYHVHGKHLSTAADRQALGFDCVTPEQLLALSAEWLRVASRWALFTSDWHFMHRLDEAGGLVRFGIWRKPDGAPQFTGDRPGTGWEGVAILHGKGRKRWNGGGKHAVWTHPKGSNRTGHPTGKPLDLFLDFVRDFTDPGDTILDPFMGSGTTGVACVELGRNFIGIEKDRKWFEVAQERIAGARFRPTLDFAARTKPPKQKVML